MTLTSDATYNNSKIRWQTVSLEKKNEKRAILNARRAADQSRKKKKKWNNDVNKLGKPIILGLFGVSLSTLTAVVGSVPLMILLKRFNRAWFFTISTTFTALLIAVSPFQIWLPFLLMSLLVAVYYEISKKVESLFWSAFAAVSIVTLVATGGLFLWTKFFAHQAFVEFVRGQMQGTLATVTAIQPSLQPKLESVLTQIPSVVMILLATGIWFIHLFEERVSEWFNVPSNKEAIKLLDFSVPEIMIWPAILSIAGTFWTWEINWIHVVAINVLSFLSFAFFLQGLCIVITFFRLYKVNFVWQLFFYILIGLQLFMVISILGFADYWMNFRDRLHKSFSQTIKEVEK